MLPPCRFLHHFLNLMIAHVPHKAKLLPVRIDNTLRKYFKKTIVKITSCPSVMNVFCNSLPNSKLFIISWYLERASYKERNKQTFYTSLWCINKTIFYELQNSFYTTNASVYPPAGPDWVAPLYSSWLDNHPVCSVDKHLKYSMEFRIVSRCFTYLLKEMNRSHTFLNSRPSHMFIKRI